MKHEQYKELLELNILGELNDEEEILLENHLFECDECATEYSQLKKIYTIITTERPQAASDEDLLAARMRLFPEINKLGNTPSLKEQFTNFLKSLFSNNYSLAFGSIILVTVGLFIGYLVFNNSGSISNITPENIIDLDKIDKGSLKISDIRLPDTFSENNEFEFIIGDSEPINYKGDINDLAVQRLLATALQSTENPGFKIRTAYKIAEIVDDNFVPDQKIKEAFISTLKNDQNPGVRKGALRALLNFPFDKKIRDAFLFALAYDDNASNRMDAINGLLTMNSQKELINDSVKSNLKIEIAKEDNEVVKNKTEKLLYGGK